ncbi:MAG: hypothetical protein ABGW69_02325 [Nanoarchaeota archaeon]
MEKCKKRKDFNYYKEKALREFDNAKKLRLIDKKILLLLEVINKKENYYTTSSCSGRITIDVEGKNKKEHLWLLKTHKTIKKEDLIKVFELINKNKKIISNAHLKVDSFILHIGCKSLDDAHLLLEACKKIGLKRTGIIQVYPRILIEILGLDRLSLPVFLENSFLINTKEESIEKVVDFANRKLIKNWERIELLRKKIEKIEVKNKQDNNNY